MSIFIYEDHNISSFDLLYESLIDAGVDDARILMGSTSITINTDTGTRAQCDQAILGSDSLNLGMYKQKKKRQIEERTAQLRNKGVESWEPGKFVELTRKYYTDYLFYSEFPAILNLGNRYILTTDAGKYIRTVDVIDIKTLAKSVYVRIGYLLNGEIELLKALKLAANKTEVDAITDTRI